MSRENPLWCAPRIHGSCSKLGIDIGETSVSKLWVSKMQNLSEWWRLPIDPV
jgi:hypothetical protein